ncbi:MAG: hypothetical protein H6559_29340 [Lewinellaceae bacterium]|nr:hypothetical protein [Lewinellaceae bacterium]
MAALSTDFDGLIVSKLDADGSEVWSKAFKDDDPDTSFYPYGDIIGTADGGFVAVLPETAIGLGLDHSVACKVSADGELLWAYRILNLSSTTGYELSANGDEVLIATTTYRNGFYLALLWEDGSTDNPYPIFQPLIIFRMTGLPHPGALTRMI